MKKFISKIGLSFLLFLFVFPIFSPAKADGVILPPPDYSIYEADQKAALFYDEDTKVEDLVLSIRFTGQAEDFGWLIPTPGKPEADKVSEDFFDQLAEMSKPKKNLLEQLRGDADGFYPMLESDLFKATGALEEESTVEVWEEKRVGILDIAVLSAEDPTDLLEWLDENGYQLPGTQTNLLLEDISTREATQSSEAVKKMYWPDDPWIPDTQQNPLVLVQDYIDDGWFFVAVKVNGMFIDSSGTETSLSQGKVSPLRLTFKTNELVYPLRISALGEQSMNILLYVFASNRMRVSNYGDSSSSLTSPFGIRKAQALTILPGPGYDSDYSYEEFDTQYANWVSKEEIEDLTTEINKRAWYQPEDKMFLTKLYASYLSYTQMEYDVLFEQVDGNQTVNAGEMQLTDWLVLPFYAVIYGPYRILEAIFSGVASFPLAILSWPLFFGFLLIFGLGWTIVFYALLRKARKLIWRLILFLLQIPGIWILAGLATMILVIPYAILLSVTGAEEGVILLNFVLYSSFNLVFFTLLFYKIQSVIDRKLSKRKKAD